VVVPAHNGGAFLREAVDSALSEASPGLEVVVVDDGSTDGAAGALAGLPVRVLRRPRGGPAAARNAGARAASGRFVTFLDADDRLAPGGLAARAAELERRPDALAIGGLPSALIDERGERVAEVFEPMAARLEFPLRLSLSRYRAGEFFPVSCALYVYRREAFARAGFFDEALSSAEDADFHFRLLALGDVEVLRVPAYERRLHGGNLSLAGARRAPAFRPEVLASIRAVNARHGLPEGEIRPWESGYLR